jgi:hypothetical protein
LARESLHNFNQLAVLSRVCSFQELPIELP